MNSAMTLKQLFLVMLLILAGLQFVPVERTNPPVESRPVEPQPVADLFRRACYDCHSNETVWPWYAQVAPLSWLFAREVNRGREELNFSEWNRLTLSDQERLKTEIWKEVKSADMPPTFYLLGHPGGQVTTDYHRLLRSWCGIPPN